ncbi:MAG: hypothetical protein KDC46_08740 [Thermoleophilia bacterium]|nr:hypothetical protein [Thermoleophilia bacterium]
MNDPSAELQLVSFTHTPFTAMPMLVAALQPGQTSAESPRACALPLTVIAADAVGATKSMLSSSVTTARGNVAERIRDRARAQRVREGTREARSTVDRVGHRTIRPSIGTSVEGLEQCGSYCSMRRMHGLRSAKTGAADAVDFRTKRRREIVSSVP